MPAIPISGEIHMAKTFLDLSRSGAVALKGAARTAALKLADFIDKQEIRDTPAIIMPIQPYPISPPLPDMTCLKPRRRKGRTPWRKAERGW